MSRNYERLIADLMSADNSVRKEAELQYSQCPPWEIISNLLTLPLPDHLRAFSFVLLRRLIRANDGELSMDQKIWLRQNLSEAFIREDKITTVHQIAHVLAECLCGQVLEKIVYECLENETQEIQKQKGLFLLRTVAENHQELLNEHKELLAKVQMILSREVAIGKNNNNRKVQVETVKTLSAVVVYVLPADDLSFHNSIPAILQVFELVLSSGDEHEARDLLTHFIQMADCSPKLFRASLEVIGNAMISIASHSEFDVTTRELALEFILSLCENGGGIFRKYPTLIQKIVPFVFNLMCQLEEDSEWANKFDDPLTFSEFSTEDTTSDDIALSESAAAAIVRLSSSLGVKVFLQEAIPIIRNYLSPETDWRCRRSALYSICLLGNGSVMQKQLDGIVNLISPCFEDSHPRVRYSALHCLGTLSDEFGDVQQKGKNFQTQFNKFALQKFITALQHETISRIQAVAASGVVNFCNPSHCKPSSVTPFLEPLVSSLLNLLKSSPRQVQEQAITAIACVARVVGAPFQSYYPIFIPVAKDVLINAKGAEYSLLRGKAMEAIALVGQAVGKEKFHADAISLMEILVGHHQDSHNLNADEAQYTVQACARIGSVLKEDFVPFLPSVIPPLFQQAQIEPDMALVDLGDEPNEGVEQIVVMDDKNKPKRLEINTSALECKTVACNMLYQYALDLEGGFLPYVEQAVTILLPLMQFKYVENIRIVSALSMGKMLGSVLEGTRDNPNLHQTLPQQLFNQIFPPLLHALRNEADLECCSAFGEAIMSVLEICNEETSCQVGVNRELLPEVVMVLKTVAEESANRRLNQLKENLQDEDYDEAAAEQDEEANSMEDDLFRSMIDSIGFLIKREKEAILPIFHQHLLPFLTQLCSGDQAMMIPFFKSQAICMIDDIIEHCGPQAHALLPGFLPIIFQGAMDMSTQIRQAALYGIGVAAECGGVGFNQFVPQALDILIEVISAPEAKEGIENEIATDNAVSSFSKLIIHRGNLLQNSEQISPIFLSWLPLTADVIEARLVHSRLVDMVENGMLLGSEYTNLTAILRVFADCIAIHVSNNHEWSEDEDSSILDDETMNRMVVLLKKLQNQLPTVVVQSAWSNLTSEQQQAFSFA